MIPTPTVKVDYLSFRESGQFSARDIAYAEQDSALAPFMAHSPTISAFAKTIETRLQHPVDRKTLVEVLTEQYASYGVKPPENLSALSEKHTFSITTAHQASLFLGPLYYVYKILSAVSLARSLKETYPEHDFVPVFVLGAEDHDLDEIDHVRLNGKTITWKTQQTGSTGAMSLSEIGEALEQVTSDLGPSSAAKDLKALLEKCYTPQRTLGVATAHFVAALFKDYGVVVANLNDLRFKQNFAPIIAREILEQASQKLIAEAVTELEEVGYSQQAHARDINFFYLQPGRRDRLVVEGDRIEVLDTDISWSTEEVKAEIAAHPERFSPNVVMRPLLQESVLPNLAYVGGGGELAYWLERKQQFAEFGVPYPVLVRRDSAWWVSQKQAQRLEKLDISKLDLLGDEHQLLKRYVTSHNADNLDFSEELETLNRIFEGLAERAKAVDPTLAPRALSHGALAEKQVTKLQSRLVRTLKKQQSTSVEQIQALRADLLPGGGLQERKNSFMEQYVLYGPHFFDTLLEHFDPLDMRLKVFTEV
ncbi:MAG: bacillithiol biosynthesis cysteine-adding enzyme BshC [Saprospiraceae bacterium]